jgi:hypothetical protein
VVAPSIWPQKSVGGRRSWPPVTAMNSLRILRFSAPAVSQSIGASKVTRLGTRERSDLCAAVPQSHKFPQDAHNLLRRGWRLISARVSRGSVLVRSSPAFPCSGNSVSSLLNLLAARNVCLEYHCSAQETLDLPRARRFYRIRRTIRSHAERAENNPRPRCVDNPDGAQWLQSM